MTREQEEHATFGHVQQRRHSLHNRIGVAELRRLRQARWQVDEPGALDRVRARKRKAGHVPEPHARYEVGKILADGQGR